LFYPKFHCEINFIEYYWEPAKLYARENYEYSLEGLRRIVPEALDSVSPQLIWKYHQKTLRIMQSYRDGYTYGTEEFRNHVYKSYCRVRCG
jgi:hypothetical protein